ncbi:hypothetical protein pb186bvf_003534 [Paramecium bursaria]
MYEEQLNDYSFCDKCKEFQREPQFINIVSIDIDDQGQGKEMEQMAFLKQNRQMFCSYCKQKSYYIKEEQQTAAIYVKKNCESHNIKCMCDKLGNKHNYKYCMKCKKHFYRPFNIYSCPYCLQRLFLKPQEEQNKHYNQVQKVCYLIIYFLIWVIFSPFILYQIANVEIIQEQLVYQYRFKYPQQWKNISLIIILLPYYQIKTVLWWVITFPYRFFYHYIQKCIQIQN